MVYALRGGYNGAILCYNAILIPPVPIDLLQLVPNLPNRYVPDRSRERFLKVFVSALFVGEQLAGSVQTVAALP